MIGESDRSMGSDGKRERMHMCNAVKATPLK